MYQVNTINDRDIVDIINTAKESSFGIVFDSREIADETRITVSPYDVGGHCGEYGLLYIDQLVFGEVLSPELAMLKDSTMKDWWMNVLGKWMMSLNIIFLTSATTKNIESGDCLATRLIQRVTAYKTD